MIHENLPDVALYENTENPAQLKWVGMEAIAVPIMLRVQDQPLQQLNAIADVYVSLEQADNKGIHMSRLHAQLNQLADSELSQSSLSNLLQGLIDSQQGISQSAKVNLNFSVLLSKPSLLTENQGYQSYPVKISAKNVHNKQYCQLELVIPYSSTCPCSASLSRQLYSNAINQTFNSSSIDKEALLNWVQSPAGSVATPHSQRSFAYIKLSLNQDCWFDLPDIIFAIEKSLGTPVQTVVKRQDEQEFARLNAENLMFCEDAARKIKNHLESLTWLSDYWFKVEHQESLHAHNAVVIDQKFPKSS